MKFYSQPVIYKSMKIPKHLAIIMDGNGRWAKKRSLPKILGHRSGIKTVDLITEECSKLGVEALTLYTFSSENWTRPKEEVDALMQLLRDNLVKYGEKLKKNNIRFNTIGKINELSAKLYDAIQKVQDNTADNKGMILTLALNYGGRQEILEAVKAVCRDKRTSSGKIDSLQEKDFEQFLFTQDLPALDFVIRTSGEKRISNFLLWQMAYTEFYFTNTLWPDFDADELQKALEDYRCRKG